MPQIPVNSPNILNFQFKVTFNIYQRSVIFDTSLTTYQGGGASAVLGICFSFMDQDGVELAGIDFTNPQIPHPNITPTYTLDLSSVNFAFLFQKYQIIGAIKDSNGTVYQTVPVFKKVCQPVGICEDGTVPGMFQLIPDCVNNVLSVKDLTLLVYNNQTPSSVTQSGNLYYPTGTIAAVPFTSTPFSNNVVYTGSYRITCTTVGEYNLGDDFYVDVTYLTSCPFDVSCTDRMSDLLCCIESVQAEYLRNCDNAKGQNAKQLLDDISVPLFLGINKEINGQDSSDQAAIIKKILNCDCGVKSIRQNQPNPVNPSVYSIVVTGVNGTTVTPSQSGSTKTFTVSSNIYQVVKGDTGDLSYSITLDNSTPGVTKYKLAFDDQQLAINILDAISANPSIQAQLNALITSTGVSLQGLNGGCIIDLTKSSYTITQLVQNGMLVGNVVINGTTYNAPTGLSATDTVGIANWLNSLTLGTFSVSINSLVLLIQTLANPNTVSTISFTSPTLTVQFSSTNDTLVQVLQAIINYFCQLTALQIALGQNLTLCTIDYNGNTVVTNYKDTSSQGFFNQAVSQAICNIVARITSLTGVTCAVLKSIFQDNPTGVFGPSDRVYGTLGGSCSSLTDQQTALMVIAAVGKYANVQAAWCSISCGSPATCPDVSNVQLGISGPNVAVFGITWATTPTATQTVTVKWRVTGTSAWNVATNGLLISPSGAIQGTTPYVITSASAAGTEYDVQVINNCGGVGAINQITTPTTSVFTGSYLLDNVLYNICGDSPTTLYSSSPFGTAVTMYHDIGLTTPVTGFTLIAQVSTNQIFNINTSTGVVGSNTGNVCSSGTPGNYKLGNNSGTICAAGVVVLYTSGAFGTGGTLYVDSALTTPQTGFSFVVQMSTGIIYNLNSGSGVIGTSTGSTCSVLVTIQNQTSSGLIASEGGIVGFTSAPVGAGASITGTHSGFTGNIVINVSVGAPITTNMYLYRNGTLLQTLGPIPPSSVAPFTFASQVFAPTDAILVQWGV